MNSPDEFSITVESKGASGEFSIPLKRKIEFPNENYEAAITDIAHPVFDSKQSKLRELLRYFEPEEIDQYVMLSPLEAVKAKVIVHAQVPGEGITRWETDINVLDEGEKIAARHLFRNVHRKIEREIPIKYATKLPRSGVLDKFPIWAEFVLAQDMTQSKPALVLTVQSRRVEYHKIILMIYVNFFQEAFFNPIDVRFPETEFVPVSWINQFELKLDRWNLNESLFDHMTRNEKLLNEIKIKPEWFGLKRILNVMEVSYARNQTMTVEKKSKFSEKVFVEMNKEIRLSEFWKLYIEDIEDEEIPIEFDIQVDVHNLSVKIGATSFRVVDNTTEGKVTYWIPDFLGSIILFRKIDPPSDTLENPITYAKKHNFEGWDKAMYYPRRTVKREFTINEDLIKVKFPDHLTEPRSDDKSLRTIQIYGDFVKHSIVGDTQAPLLRSLPPFISDGDSIVNQAFRHPYYHAISKRLISELKFKMTDDTGDDVNLRKKNLELTLKFRKKRRSFNL